MKKMLYLIISILITSNTFAEISDNYTSNTKEKPQLIRIKELRLTKMPLLRKNGIGWDRTSGADIYLKVRNVKNPNKSIVKTKVLVQDLNVNNMKPVSAFFKNLTIDMKSPHYYIDYLEYDEWSDDERIGSIYINFSEYINSDKNILPTEIVIDQDGLSVVVVLEYIYKNDISYSKYTGKYEDLNSEDGVYSGMTHIKYLGDSKISFRIIIANKTCIGDIEGIVKLKNNIAIYKGKKGEKILFKFFNKGVQVTAKNCDSYHGASCGGFDGTYVKMKH